MKLLVTGDREWKDYMLIQSVLVLFQPDLVAQGAARGADKKTATICQQLRIPCSSYPAAWDFYGRAAGPLRNRSMYDEFRPDVVVAFHDDLINSKGTRDMVKYAKSQGTPVYLVTHD